MKTLIISDTHLTRNFNKIKFNRLKELISDADQVILNGDFWDAFLINFSQFIDSPWQDLFDVLKDKNTIYLYGNHDREIDSDERVNYFSTKQALHHKIDLGKVKLHIEHGDKLATDHGLFKYLPENHLIFIAEDRFQRNLVRLFGPEVWKRIGGFQNSQMKEWARQNLVAGEILIAGHSHFAENLLAENFLNTGFNISNWMQYLIIDDDKLNFKEERIY